MNHSAAPRSLPPTFGSRPSVFGLVTPPCATNPSMPGVVGSTIGSCAQFIELSIVVGSMRVLNTMSMPASMPSTWSLSAGAIDAILSGATENVYGPRSSVGTAAWSFLSNTLSLIVIWQFELVGIVPGRLGLITSDGPSGHVTLLPDGE